MSIKRFIILRGVPGSGKSTYAKSICEMVKSSVICEADDFMLDECGEYKFDRTRLELAHNACFEKFKSAVEFGIENIILSNTSIFLWEVSRYVEYAIEAGYDIFVKTMEKEYGSVHDVPNEAMDRFRKRINESDFKKNLSDLHPNRVFNLDDVKF